MPEQAMPTAVFDTSKIIDFDTFHNVSKEVLGFPDFYGRNMNAWIDCLRYLDEDVAMSRFHPLSTGERLLLVLTDAEGFRQRLPEVYDAMIDSITHLNHEEVEPGKEPKIAVLFT